MSNYNAKCWRDKHSKQRTGIREFKNQRYYDNCTVSQKKSVSSRILSFGFLISSNFCSLVSLLSSTFMSSEQLSSKQLNVILDAVSAQNDKDLHLNELKQFCENVETSIFPQLLKTSRLCVFSSLFRALVLMLVLCVLHCIVFVLLDTIETDIKKHKQCEPRMLLCLYILVDMSSLRRVDPFFLHFPSVVFALLPFVFRSCSLFVLEYHL